MLLLLPIRGKRCSSDGFTWGSAGTTPCTRSRTCSGSGSSPGCGGPSIQTGDRPVLRLSLRRTRRGRPSKPSGSGECRGGIQRGVVLISVGGMRHARGIRVVCFRGAVSGGNAAPECPSLQDCPALPPSVQHPSLLVAMRVGIEPLHRRVRADATTRRFPLSASPGVSVPTAMLGSGRDFGINHLHRINGINEPYGTN